MRIKNIVTVLTSIPGMLKFQLRFFLEEKRGRKKTRPERVAKIELT